MFIVQLNDLYWILLHIEFHDEFFGTLIQRGHFRKNMSFCFQKNERLFGLAQGICWLGRHISDGNHTTQLNLLRSSEIYLFEGLCKKPQDAAQNAYFSHILHGVQEECLNRQINMIFLAINPVEREVEAAIRQSGANGVILASMMSRSVVQYVIDLGLPVVLIEDYFPTLPVDGILSDALNGVRNAIHYLVAYGHQSIAFIDGPHEHYQARLRYIAYRQALHESDIAFNPSLVAMGDLTVQGSMIAMNTLLKQASPFTALMCTNDASAFGAMRVLQARGWQIPQDISIIGHDDVDAASLVTPPLTTLRTHMKSIGKLAVARLLDYEMPGVLIMTQEQLIERQTVRNLKGGDARAGQRL